MNLCLLRITGLRNDRVGMAVWGTSKDREHLEASFTQEEGAEADKPHR